MNGKYKCIIHGLFAAHHSAQEGKFREKNRQQPVQFKRSCCDAK